MEKKIYVFDLDDSLIKTTAHILVYNKDKELIRKIPTEIYNAEGDKRIFLNDGDYFDFTEFNSVEILKKEETTLLFDKFRKLVADRVPVAILTSRESREMIDEWLRYHKIDPDRNYIMILCTFAKGYPFGGSDAERKRKTLNDLLVDTFGFNDIIVYDDAQVNVDEMMKVNNRNGVKVTANPK